MVPKYITGTFSWRLFGFAILGVNIVAYKGETANNNIFKECFLLLAIIKFFQKVFQIAFQNTWFSYLAALLTHHTLKQEDNHNKTIQPINVKIISWPFFSLGCYFLADLSKTRHTKDSLWSWHPTTAILWAMNQRLQQQADSNRTTEESRKMKLIEPGAYWINF